MRFGVWEEFSYIIASKYEERVTTRLPGGVEHYIDHEFHL